MEVSDQIIRVFDDLCNRFGIAVDWTDANVVPYMSQLCERFAKFEIYTSIFWMVFVVTLAMICVGSTLMIKKKFRHHVDYEVFAVTGCILSIFSVGAMIIVVGTQVYDIIEVCTIPEKTILDYVLLQVQRRMS